MISSVITSRPPAMPAKKADSENWMKRTICGLYPTNWARSGLSRTALAIQPSGVFFSR